MRSAFAERQIDDHAPIMIVRELGPIGATRHNRDANNRYSIVTRDAIGAAGLLTRDREVSPIVMVGVDWGLHFAQVPELY